MCVYMYKLEDTENWNLGYDEISGSWIQVVYAKVSIMHFPGPGKRFMGSLKTLDL